MQDINPETDDQELKTKDGEEAKAEPSADSDAESVLEDFEKTPLDGVNFLVELENKATEFENKWRRAMAETENVRRRAERERRDGVKYGAANFAKAMLSVLDNLHRALGSVSEQDRAENEALSALWAGVQMTEREMMSAFERFGVKPVETQGQKLNPHLHEAMFEVSDPNQPVGTVIQVIQLGYMFHDRLLRAAKVGVTKDGPKEAAIESAPSETKPAATAYEKSSAGKGGELDTEL